MTEDKLRVNYDELGITQDATITLYLGEPFTGIAYEEDENGHLISEVSYEIGIQEGPTLAYFESGLKQSIVNMHLGAAHGLSQHWHENGQLESERTYEYGILTKRLDWEENGHLKREFELDEHDPMYKILIQFRKNYRAISPNQKNKRTTKTP